jgi:trehalose 6-phosphate phosphatase
MKIPQEFLDRVRQHPDRSGFLMDYDGTLSEIVSHPEAAGPVQGAVEVVQALAERYSLMAFVSGRRAEFLAELFDSDRVRYCGVYGAEEIIKGKLVLPSETDSWRGMASRIARDAEAFVHTEGLDGCEVEYKDVAVSIHFRNAKDPAAGTLLIDWANQVAPRRRFSSNLGRMVVELRPHGVSKAGTFERLLGEVGLESVIAGGDDHADVDALKAAKSQFGERALAVGVASREEPSELALVSDVMVPSPSEMVDLLKRFLDRP